MKTLKEFKLYNATVMNDSQMKGIVGGYDEGSNLAT